ncbi:MAG: sigma-70 family RNA polymerase sigma factor [Pseudomonadota bacterium]
MSEQDEPYVNEEDAVEALDPMGGEARPLPRRFGAGVSALSPSSAAGSQRDLLSHYLSELRRYPLLSPEEEHETAIAYYERGDHRAGERLVTANLRLVVKLAFQYHRQWSNVLDLIQEGNVGLVQALSRYDPYRGIRFSSYAQYWIRAMILRFLMDNYRLVRLGSTRAARQLFFQLRKERERLIKEGLQPKTRLIAERLSVSESEVIAVDRHMRAPAMSLDAPLSDGEGRALVDVMPDEDVLGPETDVVRGQLQDVVRQKLALFAESLHDVRELAIWNERLMAYEPESLSALGERFGVSKERIRQLEVRIRKNLKVFLKRELGEEIDFEFTTT